MTAEEKAKVGPGLVSLFFGAPAFRFSPRWVSGGGLFWFSFPFGRQSVPSVSGSLLLW